MPGPPLNWLAILASTPVLLALRLTTTSRRHPVERPRDRWIELGYGVLVSFVYAWLIALAVSSVNAKDFGAGAGVGAAAYVGIRLASMFFYAGFHGTDTLAWWLRTCGQLVTYALLGGMLAVWR